MQLSETDGYLFAMENIYHFVLFEENRTKEREVVTDKGNGGQPACPGEWKLCKEEH